MERRILRDRDILRAKGTLLLLDVSQICVRNVYAHISLTYEDKPTGGLYGSVKQLVNLINYYKPKLILACCDHRPYYREDFFPEYKKDRKKLSPDAVEVIEEAKKSFVDILHLMGIPVVDIRGFEADDIIAYIVLEYASLYSRVLAFSNDSDLYQLLDCPQFSMIKSNKGAYTFYDWTNFVNQYPGLEMARDWIEILSLAGTHNGVPGIKGVGVKTAIKVFCNDELRKDFYRVYGDVIDRNRKLIALPYAHEKLSEMRKKAIPRCFGKYEYREIVRKLGASGIQWTGYMQEAMEVIHN